MVSVHTFVNSVCISFFSLRGCVSYLLVPTSDWLQRNVGYVSWRHGVCLGRGGNTEFFICPSVAANTTHSCSAADCYSATWACPDTLRPTGAPLTACALTLRQHSLPHFPQQTPPSDATSRTGYPQSSGGNTRAPSSKSPRCALEFCSLVGKALTWPPQNREIFVFTPQSLRWQRWVSQVWHTLKGIQQVEGCEMCLWGSLKVWLLWLIAYGG